MITEYKDAELSIKKNLLYFVDATKIEKLGVPFFKSVFFKLSPQSISSNKDNKIFQKNTIKILSKNTSQKVLTCISSLFKGCNSPLGYRPKNFSNLSKLISINKTINKLKQNPNWLDGERTLAGSFFELKDLCNRYDIRDQAKKEITNIFNLYMEPEESKSSEENVATSEEMHDKLQAAFEKLDDTVFHSRYFIAQLFEKIKYGKNYGILALCPQLFEGLVQSEEDREKFKDCLLNPEILHDSKENTLFLQSNYVTYLKKHSDIVANAFMKGLLCKLLMTALDGDTPNQKEIIDSLTPPRETDTYIGPQPNDRYKYLDYLPQNLLDDTDFLINLVTKDHEVFHHLPKDHQDPIKEVMYDIFYNSKDKEFFFTTFSYLTDESKDNFLINYIANSPTLSRMSQIPENLMSIDLLLKSIKAIKELKMNMGEETYALEIIYMQAIDRVNNSKIEDREKDVEMYKIHKHMVENNLRELGKMAWDLIKNPWDLIRIP